MNVWKQGRIVNGKAAGGGVAGRSRPGEHKGVGATMALRDSRILFLHVPIADAIFNNIEYYVPIAVEPREAMVIHA